ncbi:hypothetical protein H0H92_013741 [Tricholoma furcatifolium]|nr:hypothetical protein H0H92_013741 [Tricholoma furcatifolium]
MEGTEESEQNPIQEKKKQLRQWFNNNSQKMRKQSTQNPALAFFDAEKLSKGKQTLHASEFWSKTNYKEKVKPLVKAELAALNVPANRSLPIIKRHIRAAFDAEPEASRQLIYAEIEEGKVRAKAEAKAAAETPVSRTPAQVAAVLQCLPNTLVKFCNAIQDSTGFYCSVIAAGPDPTNGGRICSVAHHAGLNKLGHNFSQAHAGYKENFVGPYVAFVRSSYTQDDLDSQALRFQHQAPLSPERRQLASASPPETAADASPPKTAADTSPSPPKAAANASPKAHDASSVPEFRASAEPREHIDPILYMLYQTPDLPTPEPPTPIVQQPSTVINPDAFPFGPVVCPDNSEFVFPDDMFLNMTVSIPPSPTIPTPSSPELSTYLEFFNPGPRALPALALTPTPDITAEPVTEPVIEPEPSPVIEPEPRPVIEPSPIPVIEPSHAVIKSTMKKPSVLTTVEEGRRGARICKGARPRDAPTLTLDAEGVQVADAYGRPLVPQKRTVQKENKRPAKRRRK